MAKRNRGETVLTSIHHRQTPAWVVEGATDVGVVWETENLHHLRLGAPIEVVHLDDDVNQRGHYASAVVTTAPHADHARAFVDYIASAAGRRTYARFGFTT